MGNKAQLEGSIEKGYNAQEAFDIEIKWNQPRHVDDETIISQRPNSGIKELLFPFVGKPFCGLTLSTLPCIGRLQAH